MASQDEVNAQHLAVAGLDPSSLGKPSEAASGQDDGDRCLSRDPSNPSHRCALRAGHGPGHLRGTARWIDATTSEPTKQRPGDQPLPIVNNRQDIQSMVINDITERRLVGISRYGSALQAFNGRDALQDLYEELIDASMYIKQLIVERDS